MSTRVGCHWPDDGPGWVPTLGSDLVYATDGSVDLLDDRGSILGYVWKTTIKVGWFRTKEAWIWGLNPEKNESKPCTSVEEGKAYVEEYLKLQEDP